MTYRQTGGHTTPAADITELKTERYPNVGERILRAIREVVAIVALVLASVIMILALVAAKGVIDGVRNLGGTTPDPSVSIGCPFGPDQCGG